MTESTHKIAKSTTYDENIICPVTGAALHQEGDFLTSSNQRYHVKNGIPLLFVDENAPVAQQITYNTEDAITRKVQDFYEDAPFPNYNSFDNLESFVRQADAGIFARLLRNQIPLNANILEVGCGTAQLSNYLAATTLSRVYASDMTPASLKLGDEFAKLNGIESTRFLQMNLFKPAIRPESMDIVISNGVLHHTYDTKKAFMSISKLVKPDGYIIIGLYNHIGRLRTDIRRFLIKYLGQRILFLDPHLRKNLSPEKRRAWIRDQFYHPQERKHSMSELLDWFEEAGFSFISAIPKIRGEFSNDEQLFQPQNPGTHFDRTLAEIGMLFSQFGGEGGLFICVGKKKS